MLRLYFTANIITLVSTLLRRYFKDTFRMYTNEKKVPVII